MLVVVFMLVATAVLILPIVASIAVPVFAAVLAANPVLSHKVHRPPAGAIPTAIATPVGLPRLPHIQIISGALEGVKDNAPDRKGCARTPT